MASENNFLRLKQLIGKYFRVAVSDPRFGHSKLSAVADELGMSPDELNNMLYPNRVDINESYVQSALDLLSRTCPDLAARLLQEWLIDPRINFGEINTAALTGEDVRTIFLKAIREAGELGGDIADAEADGKIDRDEAASGLRRIETIISILNCLKARYLRDQASALDINSKRNGKSNGN